MRNKYLIYPLFLVLLFFLPFQLLGQETIPLEDLSGFRSQSGNWMVVGDVIMDRTIDVHKKEIPATETKKKRKKKRKGKVMEKPRKAVSFSAGSGILLNYPNDTLKDHLISEWEHGDILLEMEVMMPKGSNSGIYLQGRYEIQLLDSWGVKEPSYGDIGGIYRNWEETPGNIFLGVPPSSNAAKAPGLWQKLKIDFRAPKFDDAGNKIANAKFVSVLLNGVPIHENVEVPLPTGGPISKKEVKMGPLMIQGDHGPVAFRNIKKQSLLPSKVTLTDLEYAVYKGNIKRGDELDEAQLSQPIKTKEIDISQIGEADDYWIVYKGKLQIPEDGQYQFQVGYSGGTKLFIDEKLVEEVFSVDWGGKMNATATLTEGAHDIRIDNMKSAPWRNPRLGLAIRTSSTQPKYFNAYDSDPTIGNLVSPIFVDVENEPRLLRGFVFFNNGREKLSHTIGVGTPSGVHYVYDLECGNLVGAWRGNYIDATPMWHNRGNGSFRPNGATIWTFLNQPFAQLSTMQEAFPSNDQTKNYVPKGYSIDSKSKLPLFKYRYKDIEVTNTINPSTDGNYLVNELTFSKKGLDKHYYKLAEGHIKKMPDGSYSINDEYYLALVSGQEPIIREFGELQELLVSVNGDPIKYNTIW